QDARAHQPHHRARDRPALRAGRARHRPQLLDGHRGGRRLRHGGPGGVEHAGAV
ncbi:MAG: ATP-dependent Clp protease proteolytic subunit, partial [uncultured Sphingomonas sp.]